MPEVFGRKYEVYIGLPTELIYKHTTPVGKIGVPPALIAEMNLKTPHVGVGGLSSLTGGYIDYVTIPKKVIKIDSYSGLNPLQFEAEISYNKNPAGGKAAPAKIKLYNLNKETLSYAQKDAAMIIKAGYVQDKVLPLIYVGQIISSKTQRDDNGNNITEIVCGDAIVPIKMVKFSGSYSANTTHNKMIGDVMDVFAQNGVPKGIFKATDRTRYENNSARNFVGTAAGTLDTLCKEIDYTWYVTKGKLNVMPKERPRTGKLIEVYGNNIIGKVELSTNNASTSSNSPDSTTGGVKFKMFLDGNIDNTVDVSIKEGDFKGDYSVDSVDFKLDFYGTDWYTEVEASVGRTD